MTKFHVLLRFSMAKRLRTRTFAILNVILSLLLLGLFFADRILLEWNPDFMKKQLVYVDAMPEFVSFAQEQSSGMKFLALPSAAMLESVVDEDDAWVVQKEADYYVIGKDDFPALEWIQLSDLIMQYEDMMLRSTLTQQQYELRHSAQVLPIMIGEKKESTTNQTWAFLLITSIYFVALSYVGIAASDVVYEKSTRMMELILTCVSSTTHLIAKLLSGWLMLLVQLGLLLIGFMMSFGLRYWYDKGNGLVSLLRFLGMLPPDIEFDFGLLIQFLIDEPLLIGKMVVAMALMLIGILFVQTILVVLSSFIGSIEEAGTIQSPFYLLFMGVYYLTLFLNTPEQMNEGIGYTLSFLPFFSMLFMPCRMFYYEIVWMEVGFSLLIAVGSLTLLWLLSAPLYQRGVLDYSSKPLLAKLRSSLGALGTESLFQRR